MACPHKCRLSLPQLSPRAPPDSTRMARKKRSHLPAVTAYDLATSPDRVRRTSHGWAWKCAYCGQYASSETLTGKYVCRSHGGVTPRQRDPIAQQIAREHLRPIPRPPGRPLLTGRWSRRSVVEVDRIVEDYKARQLDPDQTDEDMLYLRATLAVHRREHAALKGLDEVFLGFSTLLQVDGTLGRLPPSVDLATLQAMIEDAKKLTRLHLRVSQRIEKGHERLIKLAKVRAETRLKNSAADQLAVFTLMVERLDAIFKETLPPETYLTLQLRLAQELRTIPESSVG